MGQRAIEIKFGASGDASVLESRHVGDFAGDTTGERFDSFAVVSYTGSNGADIIDGARDECCTALSWRVHNWGRS